MVYKEEPQNKAAVIFIGKRLRPYFAVTCSFFVTFHTHANHSADWRGADTVMGPKGLPLAEGDFKWAVPVTIRTLIK